MPKLKLKHYIVLLIVFFSWIKVVNANLIINEVQLAPTEDRFIELYNSGSGSLDLTNWYIQRKTATGSTFGSLVSKTYFEGVEIKANEYLLISKNSLNNSDIVIPNLTLTESNTIQIKNSNQEVVDSLEWETIPEGKSFQKISGDYKIGSPTPGFENSGLENTDNDEETISNEDSDSSDSDDSVKEANAPRKITAKIIAPKIIFAEIPFQISSLVTTNKKETLAVGKFRWNFGDGNSREDLKKNDFEYTYFYPGEYVVLLDYYERKSSNIIDDSDRITLRVLPREIFISGVGDIKDPFIEIENKSNSEIVLSGWIITAGNHYFKIPDGTIILANKKVKFSSKITGFVLEDLIKINITNSKGVLIASYPQIKTPISKKVVNVSNNISPKITNTIDEKVDEDLNVVNLNDLKANAVGSNLNTDSNYTYLGLGGVIVIGIISILLLRRKKEEIGYLDDPIRAEDIKIVE